MSPSNPDATIAALRNVCSETELRALFGTLNNSPMPTYGSRSKGYLRAAIDDATFRSLGLDTYLTWLLIWKGKAFYTNQNGGTVYNLMGPFGVEALPADAFHGSYPFDSKQAINVKYPPFSPGSITRDYIREVLPGVYLGLGLIAPVGLPTDNLHVMSFILDFR